MAMVAVLLLLACVNIASLLLARGAGRAREMSLRVAVGASRWRLWRQVFDRITVAVGSGALIGVALAYAGATTLVQNPALGSADGPDARAAAGVLDVQPDVRVLLFTAVVAVVTGVLFGMVPAWNAFASAQISTLRDGGTIGERRSGRLAGRLLVVCAGRAVGDHFERRRGAGQPTCRTCEI